MTQRPLPGFLTGSQSSTPEPPAPFAPADDATPSSPRAFWWALAILLITAGIFAVILRNGFTWDDNETIYQNPNFRPATFSSILSYWTQKPVIDTYYNPVTYTVWGIIARAAIMQQAGEWLTPPAPFHAVSVIVHSLSAVVVFLILRRLFDRAIAAFIGALLFALHPLQVETVAWASGLKDLLCGLFSFLSIWLYIRSRQSETSRSAILGYALATVAFILALLSKPTAVVLPLIIAGLDVLAFRARPIGLLQRLGPWLALSIAFSILTAIHLRTPPTHEPAPIWARPLIAGDAVVFYLVKLILPLHLAPDYGRVPHRVMEQWTLYIAWVIPVLGAALLFALRRQAPRLTAAGWVFLLGLFPTLGFVSFAFQEYSTVADHYMYIPMLGVAMAGAWILDRYRHSALPGIAAAVLLVLAVLSVRQATLWRLDGVLWEHTKKVNPRSFAAENNLGHALHLSGNEDQAATRFAKALQLNPRFGQARRNLDTYVNRKQQAAQQLISSGQSAGAIPHLRAALRFESLIPPDQANELRFFLGVAYLVVGQYEQGLEQLFVVQKANPQHADARRAIERGLQMQRDAATRPSQPPPGPQP